VRSSLATAGCLCALLAPLGCAPSPPLEPPPPPPPPAVVEDAVLALGAPAGSAATSAALLPFTDGQEVELVAGAQGGFHVWLQYALRGLPAATYTLERDATRVSDGAVVLRYSGAIDVGVPAADGWSTAPAPIPMFMCPTPIGVSVIGEPIALLLRVVGGDGLERARAGATLVPRCPDAQRDFCTHICSG
jgi:hypothetical protein